ncbi:MAG TPA: TolC family protein, partial [Bacteroidales bacterium]|nr:TolC family protein [Bacteroidales bacterium]
KPIIMSDQFSGKVQLSQLIFSGQYMVGLQIAKIVDKIANQNLVLNELDVKESVINSYYSILVTQQTLQIINENINNLNELLKHKTNLYKAGAAEEIDVDQLTMTINQLKNNQNSLERAIEIGYNILKFQLGVPPDTKIELSDNINQIIDNIDYEILVNKDFQVSDNVNYQLMQSQVNLKEKQLGLQNWSYAPTIAGFYSYTKKIKTTGFDMTPNHLAGLNVSIPIFSSGLRKARVSQAKIDLDVSRRNIELVKEQLETQHKQLLFNYYNALENFKTQQENIIIAKKVLNNIENKYRQGLISSLEFVQANSNYLNAQSNYINATLTLLQAKTALNKLYNKL